MSKKSWGFTLVEILIVVAIIGILAGVLVGVMDPIQQQNKARDAGSLATLNKFLLVAQGHASARGRAPTEEELDALIDKFTPLDGADCTVDTPSVDQSCRFSIEGVELPNNCGTANWTGAATGTGQCHFYYYRDSAWDSERFRIFVRSWGLSGRVFVIDTTEAGVFHCEGVAIGAAVDADLGSVAYCEEWTD